MSIIIRRFLEILLSCAFLSSGITLLYSLGMFSNYKDFNVVIVTFVILFVLYNIYAMYNCYLFLINKWRFYFSNYIAYLIFAVVTYVSFYFFDHKTYMWLFGITKFIYFGGTKALWIITVFHIVIFAVISILPIGVHYIKVYQEEERWITDVFDDGK